MKRVRTSVVIAGLLLASLVAVGAAIQPAATAAVDNSTTDATTVSVSGTGQVATDPDQALVDVAATETAASPSAASEQLANRTERLRAALADAGFSGDAVRTTDYQLYERSDENETTYVARQAYEITVSDTGDVGRVVDVAVAGGATEVLGVSFTLSPEQRRTLRTTAIDRAVTGAREQADAVAASTDLTLDGVRSVSVDQNQVTAVERAAAPGTTIEPSPVTVTATVRITYAATATGDGAPTPTATATPTATPTTTTGPTATGATASPTSA
ncbi:MAG: SIMPL domain-containing protein [Haloplanus sp.]